MSSYQVSVLMACNKIDKYTFQAIDSVLSSVEVEFEVVIVSNGPNAESIKLTLEERYSSENNIIIDTLEIGQLASSLNYGIGLCSGKYIARMDTDDICHFDRLIKQYSFMEDNNIDVCGSFVNIIDADDGFLEVRNYPLSKKNISIGLCLKSPFCHPSMMIKKDVLVSYRGYAGGFVSEDYDLWMRMNRDSVSWANIPETLLSYRVHKSGAQGNMLAYCEVSSYFLRELLYKFNFLILIGLVLSILKVLRVKIKRLI